MQWGGGPEARKGAAIAVLAGRQPESLRQTSLAGLAAVRGDQTTERLLFLWSGKIAHANASVKDDLWVFDLERHVWRRQYSYPLSTNHTGMRDTFRWTHTVCSRKSINGQCIDTVGAAGVL